MSDILETVKVVCKNEQGYMIINKADMTKDHQLYTEKTVKPALKKKTTK